MEITLSFDFDNHEDVMAHMRFIKSKDMALVLLEIEKIYTKFEEVAEDSDGIWVLDKVCEHIQSVFEKYSIETDNLIE